MKLLRKCAKAFLMTLRIVSGEIPIGTRLTPIELKLTPIEKKDSFYPQLNCTANHVI